jgi:hypothetical protein
MKVLAFQQVDVFRAALLSAKSRAMTESGAARPGDSQGRNLLHEKPRGDPRLADVAPVDREAHARWAGRAAARPQSKLRCGGGERAALGSGGARKYGCNQTGCGGVSVVEQPSSLIGALNSPHDKSADKRQSFETAPISRGTESSNPTPSTGESANFQSLSVMTPSLAVQARCPARTERAHIARRRPAATARQPGRQG